MSEQDRVHAAALELAENIADRLRRLESARAVFFDLDRLVQLTRALAALEVKKP